MYTGVMLIINFTKGLFRTIVNFNKGLFRTIVKFNKSWSRTIVYLDKSWSRTAGDVLLVFRVLYFYSICLHMICGLCLNI